MFRSARAVISAIPRLQLRHTTPTLPLMAHAQPNGLLHSGDAASRPPAHTLTSLKRWSVAKKEIPAVTKVKAIHVYDFDNTLFNSPLPNPQLWNSQTIGFLQTWDGFCTGGWWHDPTLLTATGEGVEVEETRAWKGWWNEQIVQLVEISMQQKDAVTVLLTGRGEANFADIVTRIVNSRKLEFDLVCLKPDVGPNGQQFITTMSFKQAFLHELIMTYKSADEIRVYEDRVKHIKRFREYFEDLNRTFLSAPEAQSVRRPILAEVIPVAEGTKYLPPVTEVAEVQKMINSHNSAFRDPALNVTKSTYGHLQIKKTVFYTGYIASSADTSRLVNEVLNPLLPPGLVEGNDLKYMANCVMIVPRPAPKSILDRVGGMGKKVRWQVTGTGNYDNQLWAARVKPIPETEKVYTEHRPPCVVLALRKGARPADAAKIQNWQPVAPNRSVVFDTEVGEKVLLRVEEEDPDEGEWESQFMNRNHKRPLRSEHNDDTDGHLATQPSHQNHTGPGYSSYGRPYPNDPRQHGNGNRHYHDDAPRRGYSSGGFRGRGRGFHRGRGRGDGSFRGGRGRGRGGGGGHPHYRSLDDHSGYENQYTERPGQGSMNY